MNQQKAIRQRSRMALWKFSFGTSEFFIFMAACLLILLCSRSTEVLTGTRTGDSGERTDFCFAEEDYCNDLKNFLAQEGYQDSGINLLRTVDMDVINNNGSVIKTYQYTVEIYHRRIDLLNEKEKLKLIKELSAIEFPAAGCTVRYKFLKTL